MTPLWAAKRPTYPTTGASSRRVDPPGEKKLVSTPSGISVARPGRPLRSQMRPASSLHTLSPAALRSAQRSSHRNGTG